MDGKKGIFYGVGIGPGDPELITLKAKRVLESCPVIATPQTSGGKTLALDIASQAVNLEGKTIVPLFFTMARDKEKQHAAHCQAAEEIEKYLAQGLDVAMLNLGDVSVYATFGYLQELLQAQGYITKMLAGVPSFCASAARLNQSLTGGMNQPLTIAPGGAADSVLDGPGSKVLMKTGRQLPQALEVLAAHGKLEKSAMVCNCGLPNEEVWPDLSLYDAERQAGYFATILVKE